MRSLAIAVLALVGFPAAGLGCVCAADPTTCESLAKAQVAFVGLVLSGSETYKFDPPRPLGKAAVVQVETVVRGLPGDVKTIPVSSGLGTSCYFQMQAGERWLVLGRLDRAGTTVMSMLCSGSREIRPGDVMTERMVESYTKGPNLFFGRARRYAGWDTLANVDVRLTGDAGEWTGKTDSQGLFETTGIRPGEYRFEATAPGMSREMPGDNLGLPASGGAAPPVIRMPELGCVEAPVTMWPDQGISGTLPGIGGRPVGGVMVRAYRLDEKGGRERFRQSKSAENGEYTLPRLPDGSYLVGVNTDGGEDTEPYRLTFYPSAHSARAASRVEVRGGMVAGIDIILDTPRTPARVTVQVTSQDGSPARAVIDVAREDKGELYLRAMDRPAQRFPPPFLTTDQAGKVTVELFGGDEYIFTAKSKEHASGEGRAIARDGRVVVLRLMGR